MVQFKITSFQTMKNALFFLFFCSMAASAQQFPVSTRPFTFKGRQLIVGSALGKLEKEYRLLDDGGIYRRMNTDTTFEKLGNQTPKNVEIAFNSLADVDFQKMDFNYPSRNSNFVKYKKGKEQHEVFWGDKTKETPAGIIRVYKAFMGMIPANMRL